MNIEESIEILKEIKKNEWGELENCFSYGSEAIETLLTAYEKEKEKNKEYEKQLDLDYAENKIKEAYIDGTNVAHNLCNKKWEGKIKAKIEEIEKLKIDKEDSITNKIINWFIEQLQSLLEERG